MNKVEKERNILKLATPLLSELYGIFDIIPEQLDKPDAAINLKASNITIGIEITSIDKQKDQQYLNDDKIARDVISQQLKDLLKDGSHSSQPTKKISIPFPRDYIFENVFEKAQKYQSYIESIESIKFGKCGEMLILAFSSHLSINDKSFNNYHKPWTNFLLSEKKFPFDKVIFVCEHTKKSGCYLR